MSRKFALILGNTEYLDPKLSRLAAPDQDVAALAEVLRHSAIGGFDEVTTFINRDARDLNEQVEGFFANKHRDDLLVLYFSGHGIKDDSGRLYLAVQDTKTSLLRSTAISAAFITDAMDGCRSKRIVLILDCCHSGAFAKGMKSAVGASVGAAEAFAGAESGYGRVVLTATDAMQYAWDGDTLLGEAEHSLFTHFLLEGLRSGEADINGNGAITAHELYDYIFEQMRNTTTKQTPGITAFKQEGDLVIARNPQPTTPHPAELPPELVDSIYDQRPWVRKAALEPLRQYLESSNPSLLQAARLTLETVATQDDSREVREAALLLLRVYVPALQLPEEDANATTRAQPDEKDVLTASQTAGQLIVQQGDEVGKVYPLRLGNNIIGREPHESVTLVFNDKRLSRKHAKILAWATGSYVLEDLNSKNGTYVNGQLLTGPHVLMEGDVLVLGGKVWLTFHLETLDGVTPPGRRRAPTQPISQAERDAVWSQLSSAIESGVNPTPPARFEAGGATG